MESVLDSNRYYYYWLPVEAVLKDRQLRIVLADQNFHRMEITNRSRRVIVQFDDVICLHVFDEYSRLDNDVEEEREPHVVALHKKSVLIAWLKESTYLFHLSTKDAPLHYSVLTANEYYHVITRIEPSISEEHSL